MVVVHLNVYDTQGGAARAAYRLHRGLRARGIASLGFVQNKFSNDESIIEYRLPTRRIDRWLMLLRQKYLGNAARYYEKFRQPGMELFTDARSMFGARPLRQLPHVDLIHLHWIARYVDVMDIATMTMVPAVWTLHDMNAFTGGCHYAGACDRYLHGCGQCPQLGSQCEGDLSRLNYRHKQKAFSLIAPHRLHIVAPSRWLAQLAENSPLLSKFPVSAIPNGIEPRLFSRVDKLTARRSLRITATAKVVMFVADSLANKRKGFALLAEALRQIEGQQDYRIIAVGKGDIAMLQSGSTLCFGSIDNDELLVSLLSAADVFVIPSLEDNFPNTVLEAMACGVPVVGFAAGGIPEMVQDNRCGLLVPVGEVDGLVRAIVTVCEDDALQREFSRNARAAATEKYPVELQSQRYLELYRGLLS